MSRLTETKRAYDKLIELLNQEIRKRSGSTQDLERFRQTLDVAFYLLGWGQFARECGVLGYFLAARDVRS
jgi:hypothetical protein